MAGLAGFGATSQRNTETRALAWTGKENTSDEGKRCHYMSNRTLILLKVQMTQYYSPQCQAKRFLNIRRADDVKERTLGSLSASSLRIGCDFHIFTLLSGVFEALKWTEYCIRHVFRTTATGCNTSTVWMNIDGKNRTPCASLNAS